VNFTLRHRLNGRRPIDDLDLQLMRCRRRDENAWILVARVSGAARVADLLAGLRMTDAARVELNVHGEELVCVLDAAGLDRHALERRLGGGMPDAGVRFGWSNFPEDGASLDVLLHKARAGLPRPLGLVRRPAGAVPTLEVESE
jgi:hypothetical protein